jgi:hypothetical protein
MQVDNRWAEPVVPKLASVPIEEDKMKDDSEQCVVVHSSSTPSQQTPVNTTVFFPPQRVEPIDMTRSCQQITVNQQKTDDTPSATTDEHPATASYMKNRPIQRVKHPADGSSLLSLLQSLSILCFILFVSLPFAVLTTILFPLFWLIRFFLRLTCRLQCTVTPCSCSYLSTNDLFWFYNDHLSSHPDKADNRAQTSMSTVSPTAGAIFFLEGRKHFSIEKIIRHIIQTRLFSCLSFFFLHFS